MNLFSTVIVLFVACMTFTSCLQRGVIQFEPKKDEILTTDKMRTFMKNNPNPSIVLKVPSVEQQATQSNPQNYIYNIIEKELVLNGFDVKDRGLYNEVLSKSKELSYSGVKELAGAELILELVRVEQSLKFQTNRIYKESKEIILQDYNVQKYGSAIEFKVILVETNEYGGSYSFFETPCEPYVPDCNCYLGFKAGGEKVYPKISYCESSSGRAYELHEVNNEFEEFVQDGIQQVITELRTN